MNAAEDKPVVAGDVVYVGPGVYRELLTVDVSGAGGNVITYIGDVTGEHTDGVGGVVRITGSNNDQAAVRSYCIFDNWAQRNYRTFRGFKFDMVTDTLIYNSTGGTHWIIEDCSFSDNAGRAITVGGTATNNTIRRCMFNLTTSVWNQCIYFTHNATVDNTSHLVENCIFTGGDRDDLYIERIGGITVRNCAFLGDGHGVYVAIALAGGQTTTVNNCIFQSCTTAVRATAVGEITENFNTFFGNNADRTNTNVGANSVTYPSLMTMSILHSGASQISGFEFPWWFGELSEWSQVRAITGSNEPTGDLRGVVRPVTASKNSWGPCQFMDMERETGTTRGASTASLCLHDAGRHQIWVPVANESTTISVYVYREANYAGNNPQMICKQPGQADDVTTDAAAASQWNLLTTTFTPAADPPYVVVELISRNTNGANDKVFFDDLVVN